MNDIEILSPAGEWESFVCAVNNGADAVYVGGSKFSARKNAVNFTDEQLKNAVEYAHIRGVKVYVALNTLIHENELNEAYNFIKYLCDIGVDALIVQDMGIIYMINKFFPDMPIHASTQMTVHNIYGTKAVEKLGFKRVVLSRELSFEQIKKIIASCNAEIEVFAHGALCMCYSGQCLMSSLIGARSGNRGACAQPCRLSYTVCDKNKVPVGDTDKYYLSLKDLCTVDELKKFRDMGVKSLKIEGRMKSKEYVSIVTSMYDKYRSGADVKIEDIKILENIFSRSGFTKGYLYGKTGADMLNLHKHNDNVYKQIDEDVHTIANTLINAKKTVSVDAYVNVLSGCIPYVVITYKDISVTAYGDTAVEKAIKVATDPQRIVEQVCKTGDSAFVIDNISYDIDNDINISIKSVNELRRNALKLLEGELIKRADKICRDYEYHIISKSNVNYRLSTSVKNMSQAKKVFEMGFERIYIPYNVYVSDKGFFDSHKDVFVLMLSNIADDSVLDICHGTDLDRVCVSNISHIECFRDKQMSADYSMNIYNTMSQKMMCKMGVDVMCLSPELNINQLENVNYNCKTEIIVYGRLKLMTVRNCIAKSNSGECNCTEEIRYLKDRKNMYFPFYTDKTTCTNSIYNSLPVYMGDRKNELININANWYRFDFTDETAADIQNIVNAFKRGDKLKDGTFTRGHYYRGVL